MQNEKPSDNPFEKLYLKERKRARAFMAATIILGVFLIGSLYLNLQSARQLDQQDHPPALLEESPVPGQRKPDHHQ